jgi:hypothetical protein
VREELQEAYDMLNAALTDQEQLAVQLQAAQAGLAAEQQARLAAQQDLERLQEQLAQAQQQRRVSCCRWW